jgi:hypothetical protein
MAAGANAESAIPTPTARAKARVDFQIETPKLPISEVISVPVAPLQRRANPRIVSKKL